MNDKNKYQSIISRLNSVCDKLDSVRSLLERSEYELSSNIINGKTLDNGNIQNINSDIVNLVNDLEILKDKYELESSRG